jgi:hypothetical protein
MIVSVLLMTLACGGSGDDTNSDEAANQAANNAMTMPDSGSADMGAMVDVAPDVPAVDPNTPVTGGPNCGFDTEMEGRNLGDQIKNFGLKTYLDDPYWLHQNCDAEKKLIWIVLATGWCGSCEGYAPRLEPIWQQYKSKGLEVMWVLGEIERDQPVSFEWAEQFVTTKGVTYPVLRDYKFYQVYGAIEPYSSSLPHMYIIDAETMELVFAQGGTDPAIEEFVSSRLD